MSFPIHWLSNSWIGMLFEVAVKSGVISSFEENVQLLDVYIGFNEDPSL